MSAIALSRLLAFPSCLPDEIHMDQNGVVHIVVRRSKTLDVALLLRELM